MIPVRVLIADDEPIARQVLQELLGDFPSVSVVAEASSGPEALEQMERTLPDLAFLDLRMPGMDGLTVARGLQRRGMPLVIFVTAYEKHALEAFESGAVDYLLKPVRKERLAVALDKARTQLAGISRAPSSPVMPPARKIVGRAGTDLHLLDATDVIAFQADGEVVYVITAQGRYLSEHSLRGLEQRLDTPRFRRIHRATIINTDHIRRISPLSSKRWLLRMSNGMEAVVSKRMAGVIRDATRW